jgi:phosphatidylglycerol:prolipoprotein diacylglycerol transferase
MITINIDPVAFTIGTLEVRWYGIIIAIAVAVVILWQYRQMEALRRKGELPTRPDITIAPVGILSGVIGAKLVHVAEQPTLYIQNPAEIFNPGGFAIYGGILGATLGIWIYLKLRYRDRKNQHFGFHADLVAPGIILAQAIGRVACTINGCCCGKLAPDWLPWSIVYTHPNAEAIQNVPLHPTQLYETVFALIGFGILLKLRGRLKPDGSLFLFYFIMYSAWRFGLGFLRTANVYYFGLSQAQIISIAVLAVCTALFFYRRHWFQATEQLPI